MRVLSRDPRTIYWWHVVTGVSRNTLRHSHSQTQSYDRVGKTIDKEALLYASQSRVPGKFAGSPDIVRVIDWEIGKL